MLQCVFSENKSVHFQEGHITMQRLLPLSSRAEFVYSTTEAHAKVGGTDGTMTIFSHIRLEGLLPVRPLFTSSNRNI